MHHGFADCAPALAGGRALARCLADGRSAWANDRTARHFFRPRRTIVGPLSEGCDNRRAPSRPDSISSHLLAPSFLRHMRLSSLCSHRYDAGNRRRHGLKVADEGINIESRAFVSGRVDAHSERGHRHDVSRAGPRILLPAGTSSSARTAVSASTEVKLPSPLSWTAARHRRGRRGNLARQLHGL
jgi:hypothetical protein